jgi:hypothetical protein
MLCLLVVVLCSLVSACAGDPIVALNQTGTFWGCSDRSCTGFEPMCIGCSFELAFYGGPDSGTGLIHRRTDGSQCTTALEQTTWKEGAGPADINVTTPEGLVLVTDIQLTSETEFFGSMTDGGTLSIECRLATGQPQ